MNYSIGELYYNPSLHFNPTMPNPASLGGIAAKPTFLTLSTLSSAISFWHGLNRTDSLAWGLGWGLMGAMFPVITPLYAVYQGYAKPEEGEEIFPQRNPRLTYQERESLPDSDFSLPEKRKYPT